MNRTHPLQRAGLGEAPYRFLGYCVEKFQAIAGDPSCPIQPGAACDFCGQGIMNVYRFRSADGKEFKLGPDCCRRAAEKPTDPILHAVKQQEAKVRREKAEEKALAIKTELETMLADDFVRAVLKSQPHPQPWRQEKGETLLDSCEWMLKCAGAAGRKRTLTTVKAAMVGR